MPSGIKVLISRAFEIRKAIAAYSIASAIDIAAISTISLLYERISSAQGDGMLKLAVIVVLLVILRTVAIFFLRRYSYYEIMTKKTRDENELVRIFVQRRSYTLPENENNIISQFKDHITNSSQLATINFDIPISSLIGEVLFAIGGIIVLICNVGLGLIIAIMPVLIIMMLVLKTVANRLRSFGSEVMEINQKRLVYIDNISEAALELCVSSSENIAAKYFDAPNIQLNSLYGRQVSISNSIQLLVESVSFIIILCCLVLIVKNETILSVGGTAASLAVLVRMVPTITRSISSVTQLHYGIPAVIKLYDHKNKKHLSEG